MIVDAVHGLDKLRAQLAEEEAAAGEARAEAERREAKVAKTKAQVRAAEERIDTIMQLGSCAVHGCTHEHHSHVEPQAAESPKQHVNGTSNGAASHVNGVAWTASTAPRKKRFALDDANVPRVWRIAFMLWNDEVLDYQATAKALWGDIDKTTAKNRISSNLAFLKNAGVIEETLGNNRFKINGEKLAARSKLPAFEEATP